MRTYTETLGLHRARRRGWIWIMSPARADVVRYPAPAYGDSYAVRGRARHRELAMRSRWGIRSA